MELKAENLLLPTPSAMRPVSIVFLFLLPALLQVIPTSHCLHHTPKISITVIGAVFCDICSNNTFTRHSYFLQGARVQVECSFKVNSARKNEIMISVDRTTDRFGIYKLDIPPIEGLECRRGRQIESFCRARLIKSSSSMCDVPGLSSSAEHLALKFSRSNMCVYNLNALNYRPSRKDAAICGAEHKPASDSSLFFWPPFPPFSLPWPFPSPPLRHIPPVPFPFRRPPPPSHPFFPPIPNPFKSSPPPPCPPTHPFPFPHFPPYAPLSVPFMPSPPPHPPPLPFPPFPSVQHPPPPPGFRPAEPRTWLPAPSPPGPPKSSQPRTTP